MPCLLHFLCLPICLNSAGAQGHHTTTQGHAHTAAPWSCNRARHAYTHVACQVISYWQPALSHGSRTRTHTHTHAPVHLHPPAHTPAQLPHDPPRQTAQPRAPTHQHPARMATVRHPCPTHGRQALTHSANTLLTQVRSLQCLVHFAAPFINA